LALSCVVLFVPAATAAPTTGGDAFAFVQWGPGSAPDDRRVSAVCVRAPRTGRVTNVSGWTSAHHPVWSRDGSRLAYVRDFRAVVVADARGRGGKVAFRCTASCGLVGWLDARRLLLEQSKSLVEVTLSGEVVRSTPYDGSDPDVSADGRRIVFRRWSGATTATTVVAEVASVAAARPVTRSTGVIETARWSPDGRRLVLTRSFERPRTRLDGLWIVGADGTGLRRIVSSRAITGAAWSADSTSITYTVAGAMFTRHIRSGRTSRLRIADARGNRFRLESPLELVSQGRR